MGTSSISRQINGQGKLGNGQRPFSFAADFIWLDIFNINSECDTSKRKDYSNNICYNGSRAEVMLESVCCE